jgi:protein-disulfide isomerase
VITRRKFVVGASALAITAALELGGAPLALAQRADPSPADLLVPPPLGDMAIGKDDAPVTVIEYASMTCPHCANFHQNIYPELKKRYIDTGKVRFIFREFPLDERAAGASMLARCAGKDKFFPLIEAFFEQQKNWAFVRNPLPPMLALAKQAGLTEESFNKCLGDQKTLDALEAERTRASTKFGVTSTPTVFVNGKMVRGGGSLDELVKLIDPLIKG